MKHLLASLAMLFALSLPPIARAQDVTLDFPSWQAEEPGFAECPDHDGPVVARSLRYPICCLGQSACGHLSRVARRKA